MFVAYLMLIVLSLVVSTVQVIAWKNS